MRRDEILKELNYQGEYTKDIKKKLNKLLKKYHPDYNKEDNKTILVLYQIKKDLEEGKLEYTKPVFDSPLESPVIHEEEKVSPSFINRMIEKLRRKKNSINIKIQQLYDELNNCYEKSDIIQEEVNNMQFLINEVKEELNNITNLDSLDISLVVMTIMICIVIYFTNIWFLFIVALILVLMEVYYIYLRNVNYQKRVLN